MTTPLGALPSTMPLSTLGGIKRVSLPRTSGARCGCVGWRSIQAPQRLLRHTVTATRGKSTSPIAQKGVEQYVEDVSRVATRALQAMTTSQEAEAENLLSELEATKAELLVADDSQGALFVSLLQSLLNHQAPPAHDELSGPYLKAFNQICSALEGSSWKIYDRSKQEAEHQQRFKTWDEVLNQDQIKQQGAGAPGKPVETELYDTLQVEPSASPSEIKRAYRKLALKQHPDVSNEPNAQEIFVEISNAYDILSDEGSRRLYDKYGKAGMQSMAGAAAGSGNAGRAWDEFKPFKKENKFTKAREASRTSYGASSSGQHDGDRQPTAGDIVEYPLSDVVKTELQDGRSAGVGLLVGRNFDRGDAAKLPEELLEMCEIEPLRQEEDGSDRWIPDELLPSAYCRLSDLKLVPVEMYDNRFDVWQITVELSEGCGGPELVEEIMV